MLLDASGFSLVPSPSRSSPARRRVGDRRHATSGIALSPSVNGARAALREAQQPSSVRASGSFAAGPRAGPYPVCLTACVCPFTVMVNCDIHPPPTRVRAAPRPILERRTGLRNPRFSSGQTRTAFAVAAQVAGRRDERAPSVSAARRSRRRRPLRVRATRVRKLRSREW